MVSDFRKFVELNQSDSCVVIGAAPSLGTVSNHQNSTGFWLGDAHRRTSVRTKKQIYVRANSEYPCLDNELHIQELQSRDFTFVIAETVMESDVPVYDLLEISDLKPAYVFDQRHFGGKPCQPEQNCCKVLKRKQAEFSPKNTTIQEHLATVLGVSHHYSTGDTVALHAFALGLLIGAREIFLTGIDIPFFQKDYIYPSESKEFQRNFTQKIQEIISNIKKYRPNVAAIFKRIGFIAKRKFNLNNKEISIFAEDFPSLFSDFQYLVDLGLRKGVKIYYCSVQSNLRKINGILPCPKCISQTD